MKLISLYEKWKKLSIKCELSGKLAIEAVESDGYALRYVKDQTEQVCLKAVERNGDALRYVKEDMFVEDSKDSESAE